MTNDRLKTLINKINERDGKTPRSYKKFCEKYNFNYFTMRNYIFDNKPVPHHVAQMTLIIYRNPGYYFETYRLAEKD